MNVTPTLATARRVLMQLRLEVLLTVLHLIEYDVSLRGPDGDRVTYVCLQFQTSLAGKCSFPCIQKKPNLSTSS